MENKNNVRLIVMDEPDFYELIDKLYERIKDKEHGGGPRWVPPEIAMSLLNIASPTTLQKLRDNPSSGIRFSQISRKIILYDRESINEYLENHSRKRYGTH